MLSVAIRDDPVNFFAMLRFASHSVLLINSSCPLMTIGILPISTEENNCCKFWLFKISSHLMRAVSG